MHLNFHFAAPVKHTLILGGLVKYFKIPATVILCREERVPAHLKSINPDRLSAHAGICSAAFGASVLIPPLFLLAFAFLFHGLHVYVLRYSAHPKHAFKKILCNSFLDAFLK